MSNIVIGHQNFADVSVSQTPAFAAFGSWSVALPLTNLQDRRSHKVARSADALAASTKFRIDLGAARAVRVMALAFHNLSTAATVQWKGGTSAGATDVYDSGALAMSYAAVTAEDMVGINFPVVNVPSADKTARHWEVDIVDTGNAAGYVQIGRLFLSAGYQPTTNMLVGASLGLEDDSTSTKTDGGTMTYQEKATKRRVLRFVLDVIAETEAFASGWKIQRLMGTTKQAFVVFNPSDTTLLHERSFPGVLRDLKGIDFPYSIAYNGMGFEVAEEL